MFFAGEANGFVRHLCRDRAASSRSGHDAGERVSEQGVPIAERLRLGITLASSAVILSDSWSRIERISIGHWLDSRTAMLPRLYFSNLSCDEYVLTIRHILAEHY